MKKLPDTITLPIKQWSLNNLIAVDITGLTCNLYRVDEFDFSEGVTFTDFTLNIDYPDDSKTGKDVIAEIRFIDTGMPPIVEVYTFEGSRITDTIKVPNNSIQGSSTRLHVAAYLFDSEDNYNVDMGLAAGMPAAYMAGSYFSETSVNPWQEPDIFTVVRDADNQEYTVSFPSRLNIKMDHGNFTNNNPVISWDPYPGADNGYVVAVLVSNKDNKYIEADNVKNTLWRLAFCDYTENTTITVFSEGVRFVESYQSEGLIQEPSLKPGEILRVEVFVLDDSGKIDSSNRIGALFMDTFSLVVN